jgi:hypothetical protein
LIFDLFLGDNINSDAKLFFFFIGMAPSTVSEHSLTLSGQVLMANFSTAAFYECIHDCHNHQGEDRQKATPAVS